MEDWFANLVADHDEHQRAVEAGVARLMAENRRSAYDYLCSNRGDDACKLAEVYVVDGAHLAYLRRYIVPRSVNAKRSTPEGRAAHTEDGEHHWRARAVDLDMLARGRDDLDAAAGDAGSLLLTVQCRHNRADLDPASMIANANGPGDHERLPKFDGGADGVRW